MQIIMIHPLLLLLLLAFSFVVYKAFCLYQNIQLAKLTGLPWTWSPIIEWEVYGYITTPILRALSIRSLKNGHGWPRWARFMVKDWPWEDKRRAHEEFGDIFVVAGSGGLICYSSDAQTGIDVMVRKNDFTKPPDKYKILEPYGPNVASAEGKIYRFHVRITAPPFSDASGVNSLVWDETMYQTHELSEAFFSHGSRSLHMDVNSLTLGVISRAGFGKRIEWTDNAVNRQENIPEGHDLTFLRAINDTTKWMTPILLLPGWIMDFTPWKQAHKAHQELDQYMREMIASEKQHLREDLEYQHSGARGNLLTSVMKASASDARGAEKIEGSNKKESFTDEEVMGNLFIYLLAGYETTANAIIYGLIILALHPELQASVVEEVDRVYLEATAAGRSELTYSDDFEKLQYTYGFMYEILRLFPGVIHITKMVTQTQTIHASDAAGHRTTSHLLPPGCRVYLNSTATHYHAKYWPDPSKLDPTRWMASPPSPYLARSSSSEQDDPKDVSPLHRTSQMRGTFLTFSDAARKCLGKNFAQAEFVAFFAGLLRGCSVGLAKGVDGRLVERDLYRCSKGSVTLAPLYDVDIRLEARPGIA